MNKKKLWIAAFSLLFGSIAVSAQEQRIKKVRRNSNPIGLCRYKLVLRIPLVRPNSLILYLLQLH
jgi:hypothetical protein